ncbi:MAG: hypothetical protein RSD67_07310 [Oscillospiraceae bacterium]
MKKIISILLSVVFATTLFAGCGHTHVWQDATCTSPKTCTECKETEGEVLAHTWKDATCTAPKTCTICGTTEGVALAHTLTQANYQNPAICTVCNASYGKPLTALFEEKGYSFMTENTEYDYFAVTKYNRSIEIIGKASITDYRIVETDETHEAKDGYEWRIANINYTFSGTDAYENGYTFSVLPMDYYVDDSIITYNGIECERNIKYAELQKGWSDGVGHVILEVAFQIPTGYDGSVLCLFNPSANDTQSGEKLSLAEIEAATPLFFRMK